MPDPSSSKNFDLVIGMFIDPIFPEVVPKMTIEEHREFVKGLLDGTVFSSMHIQELDKLKGDIGKIFLPQARGVFSKSPQSFLDDIGVLWEFSNANRGVYKGTYSKTAYPLFHTCRVCSKLDWDLACDAIKALKAETELTIV